MTKGDVLGVLLGGNALTKKQIVDRLGISERQFKRAISTLRHRDGHTIEYDPHTKTYKLVSISEDVDDDMADNDEFTKFINSSIRRREREEARNKAKLNTIEKVLREAVRRLEPVEPNYSIIPDHSNQSVVALLSDIHIGRVTSTYDENVMRDRLSKYFTNVNLLTDIEAQYLPVKDMNFFFLGDFVDGETIFPGQGFEIEIDVMEQALRLASLISKYIQTFAHDYNTVNIWATPGNHGRNGKYNSFNSNWDNVVYKFIEVALSEQENVHFHYATNNSRLLVASVNNNGFLLTHGDLIRMAYQVPYYGITNMMNRWSQSVPGWDYLTMGHFHHYSLGTKFIDKEFIINGSFLSGDNFSLERLGANTHPSQVVFGVHEKCGVTWRYPVNLY